MVFKDYIIYIVGILSIISIVLSTISITKKPTCPDNCNMNEEDKKTINDKINNLQTNFENIKLEKLSDNNYIKSDVLDTKLSDKLSNYIDRTEFETLVKMTREEYELLENKFNDYPSKTSLQDTLKDTFYDKNQINANFDSLNAKFNVNLSLALFPPGSIIEIPTNSTVEDTFFNRYGLLLCNGRQIADMQLRYPSLYSALQAAGLPPTNLPNIQGRTNPVTKYYIKATLPSFDRFTFNPNL